MAKKQSARDKRLAKQADKREAQQQKWGYEYGENAAELFSNMKSAKERYRFKNLAKQRGVSVEGLASRNTPYALKEKNRSNILTEANDTVSRAFDPALQEYDKVESNLDSVNKLRQADEAKYRSWLDAKNAAAKVDASARDADAKAYVDKSYEAAANARAQNTGQANSRLQAASEGLVGPQANVQTSAGAVQADEASKRFQDTVRNVNASAREGWDAQAAGQMGARAADREGKLSEAKNSLAQARAGIRQSKGQTFAQLMDAGAQREIDKATGERAFQQALLELNSKAASEKMAAQLDAAKFQATMGLKENELGLKQDALESLNQDRNADNSRADADLERKRLADERKAREEAKGGGSKGKARKVLSNSERNKIKGTTNFWLSTIKQVMKKEKTTYNGARNLIKARVNRGDYRGYEMGGNRLGRSQRFVPEQGQTQSPRPSASN